MNCYKCKAPVTEFQWQTKSDRGIRHLQCPNKNGKRAKDRARQIRRFLDSKRANYSLTR